MKEWKGYKHGINLGGWLSQCAHTKEGYEHFITKDDFAVIRGWGLDHVRVPVDYELVETKDGDYIEEGFGYIQRAIDWAGENGLNMILDLHKTFGFSFDLGYGEAGFFENEAYQERFYKLWEEFTRRFAKYKDRVAFELLNEVTDKSLCDKWNEIASNCIGRIRAIDSSVTILVGGYWNNSADAMPDIRVPLDEHIVYNFHCYEPLVFTHQGAGWVPGMKEFRCDINRTYRELKEDSLKKLPDQAVQMDAMPDPDAVFGADYFKRRFARALDFADKAGVPAYCGEYGVISVADNAGTLHWFKAISEAFEYYGVGRAVWSYRRMDFGISDDKLAPVRKEIIRLL